MTVKTLATLSLVLWVGTVAAIATLYVRGQTTTAEDGREAVMLSAGERDFILAEMRQMLASVQGIVTAVAEDDMAAVKEIALAIGTAEVRKVPKSLMLKLPRDFKNLGTDNHREFDDVAAITDQGGKAVTARLGILMSNCVGCHESYSLVAK